MSSYVVDNSNRRGSLGSTTRLDEKRLESTNNIGGNEFFKHVVVARLQIVDGSFQGENGGTSG